MSKTTQCTLFCSVNKEKAWEFNLNGENKTVEKVTRIIEAQNEKLSPRKKESSITTEDTKGTEGKELSDLNDQKEDRVHNARVPYTRECFDGVEMRFEEPQSTCRWDSPLFVVYPGDALDFEGIYEALFKSKPLVPNRSTQNVIYLY